VRTWNITRFALICTSEWLSNAGPRGVRGARSGDTLNTGIAGSSQSVSSHSFLCCPVWESLKRFDSLQSNTKQEVESSYDQISEEVSTNQNCVRIYCFPPANSIARQSVHHRPSWQDTMNTECSFTNKVTHRCGLIWYFAFLHEHFRADNRVGTLLVCLISDDFRKKLSTVHNTVYFV
jgi:hypothetical protein